MKIRTAIGGRRVEPVLKTGDAAGDRPNEVPLGAAQEREPDPQRAEGERLLAQYPVGTVMEFDDVSGEVVGVVRLPKAPSEYGGDGEMVPSTAVEMVLNVELSDDSGRFVLLDAELAVVGVHQSEIA